MIDYENFISGIEKLWLNVDTNKKIIAEYDPYFRKVFDLYKSIEATRVHTQTIDAEEILQAIGGNIHNLIISGFRAFEIFDKDSRIFFDMAPKMEQSFNEIARERYPSGGEKELKLFVDSFFANSVVICCLFTSVCRFLRETKRSEGKTVGKFLHENYTANHPIHPGSSQAKEDLVYSKDVLLKSEESSFRKRSEKLFSSRKGHVYRHEWSTIPPDSEFEMGMMWNLKYTRPDLEDTHKRIGNLYLHINELEKKSHADFSEDELDNAYNKTISKIEKVKYPKFLELGKYCLEEISKDENSKYYAINLYRFEKKIKLFNTTRIIPFLLHDGEAGREDVFLTKISLLDEIPFPSLHSKLFGVERIDDLAKCVHLFEDYRDFFAISSLLIFVALVDTDFFGDSWLDLFCSFSKNMAPYVLYNPSSVDYSIHQGSQEAFEKLLKRPVYRWYMPKKEDVQERNEFLNIYLNHES